MTLRIAMLNKIVLQHNRVGIYIESDRARLLMNGYTTRGQKRLRHVHTYIRVRMIVCGYGLK